MVDVIASVNRARGGLEESVGHLGFAFVPNPNGDPRVDGAARTELAARVARFAAAVPQGPRRWEG